MRPDRRRRGGAPPRLWPGRGGGGGPREPRRRDGGEAAAAPSSGGSRRGGRAAATATGPATAGPLFVLGATTAAASRAALLVVLLAPSLLAAPAHAMRKDRRTLQQPPPSPPATDFLTTNSPSALRAMEDRLFSPEVKRALEDRVFSSRREVNGNLHAFRSYRYTLEGFWRNWKRLVRDGISTGGSDRGSGGVGANGRFVLFGGDDVERFRNVTRDPTNDERYSPKRTIRIFGYEYGLANAAAFLSQAMVDGIYGDACDERNEQEKIDRNGKHTNVFPQTNACGVSCSTIWTERFALDRPRRKYHGTDASVLRALGASDALPGDWATLLLRGWGEENVREPIQLVVRRLGLPRGREGHAVSPPLPGPRRRGVRLPRGQATFALLRPGVQVPGPSQREHFSRRCVDSLDNRAQTHRSRHVQHMNDFGLKLVEGCCWWGRGPLQTKGPCNVGKLNHFLGAKALSEGRITPSTPGTYPTVDFCAKPEAVCEEESEDLLWTVAMFEWAERVQRYVSADGAWSYEEELVKFVDGGMNMYEYYGEDMDTDRVHHFIHGVSAIVDRGCHSAPDCVQEFGGPVHKLSQRRTAFTVALSAMQIPTIRTEMVAEQVSDHLKSRRDKIEGQLLRYKTKQGSFPSQRYKLDDFLDALHRFSRPYGASNITYPPDVRYWQSPDHDPFYVGDPFMKYGYKYGMANVVLFFSNALELSVEKDEACDELNEHKVSDKLPISNSCGSRGLSYQDMVCQDDPSMACKVDSEMYVTAVTSERSFGAPPPLQCGPRHRIPSTSYWDFDAIREADVSSASFLLFDGRQVMLRQCFLLSARSPISSHADPLRQRQRTRGRGGVLLVGQGHPPNEGRVLLRAPELLPGEEGLLGRSGGALPRLRLLPQSGGRVRQSVQTRDDLDVGMQDDVFIKSVAAIVQVGCHEPPCESAGCLNFPCEGATPVDENYGVTKAFRTFSELNLWKMFPDSPGSSNSPTPAPTQCLTNCTEWPSASPLPPTSTPSEPPILIHSTAPSEAPTRVLDARLAHFEDLELYLKRRRVSLESDVFVSYGDSGPKPSTLYTLDGFLTALKELATEGAGDMLFYIGDSRSDFEQGLVNIALFLAHAMTRGIKWDTCEEVNHHFVNGKLPLSNACGQHGRSYTDDICPLADAAMECAVDPLMEAEQTSVGTSRAPPFFCAPKSKSPMVGYYDFQSDTTVSGTAFANEGGREDVEGVSSSMKESATSAVLRYEHYPHRAHVFLLHLFYHETVQTYNWGYWNYMEKLSSFVGGGMEDFSFVDEFSEIVLDSSRDGAARKAHFKTALEVLFSGAPTGSPTERPTRPPTVEPTNKPTNRPTPGEGSSQSVSPGSTLSPMSPGVGSISNPGQSTTDAVPQPGAGPSYNLGPQPARPLSIDLSAPRPGPLSTITVADITNAQSRVTYAVWPFLFFILIIPGFRMLCWFED
ncbi:hypothetical protein ACHAWF_015050 [Thalassiosira exigua]